MNVRVANACEVAAELAEELGGLQEDYVVVSVAITDATIDFLKSLGFHLCMEGEE